MISSDAYPPSPSPSTRLSEWPGGLFGSPSMAGSRPGGMIAAGWAAMVAMGQSGYMEIAKGVWTATQELVAGINAMDGLRILAQPMMTGTHANTPLYSHYTTFM